MTQQSIEAWFSMAKVGDVQHFNVGKSGNELHLSFFQEEVHRAQMLASNALVVLYDIQQKTVKETRYITSFNAKKVKNTANIDQALLSCP